jgi:hypothetical protein
VAILSQKLRNKAVTAAAVETEALEEVSKDPVMIGEAV